MKYIYHVVQYKLGRYTSHVINSQVNIEPHGRYTLLVARLILNQMVDVLQMLLIAMWFKINLATNSIRSTSTMWFNIYLDTNY